MPRARRVVQQSTATALEHGLAVVREAEFDAEADAIERRRAAMAAQPVTIVLVGELSRGKSSVVNALLGVPGLAPTGDRETTSFPVVFAPPERGVAEGTARLRFADSERSIPWSDLADWVTVGGRMAESSEADALRSVEVGVDSALLPGVTIIDTPGAGGLSVAHATRALQSAQRAGILLVTTDAGGRITKDALRFLTKAMEFAGHMVIVMNKTDQNRDWRRIAEENREILRAETGSLPASFVGVSALAADHAMRASGAEADELWRFSGIPELRAALAQPIARAECLPELAALHQLRMPLGWALERLHGDVRAVGGTSEQFAELQEHKEALERLQEDGRSWRYRLQESVHDVGRRVRRDMLAKVDEFDRAWQDRLGAGMLGLSKTQAAAARAEIRAQIIDLDIQLRERISAGIAEGARRLFAIIGEEPPVELTGIDFGLGPDEALARRGQENVLQTMGLVMLAAAPARMVPVPGLTLPLTAVAVVGGLLLNGRIKNRAQAQRALADSTIELRNHIHNAISDAEGQLSIRVAEDFERALRRRVRIATEQVRAGNDAKRRADSERGAQVAALRATMARIQTAIDEVTAEHSRLSRNLTAPSGIKGTTDRPGLQEGERS